MPYYDIFNKFDLSPDAAPHESLLPRTEQLDYITRQRRFDIAIIGGGIHGAALARLAAFNGLRTILLEREDFGSGTSGRSSKMIHGGLRYLEHLDFKQVKEGVKAREDLLVTAPHLVRAWPFLLPIAKGKHLFKLKLRVAFALYDQFTGSTSEKHRWLKPQEIYWPEMGTLPQRLLGAYRYRDAVMDDFRLVIENINSARREGAFCLNYSEVQGIHKSIGALTNVTWNDRETNRQYGVDVGVVVNCGGPWAANIAAMAGLNLNGRIAFSRGSHLIFTIPWKAPALCLPLGKRGRFYFVWPHPAGAMVGTTEREVNVPDYDPMAAIDEIEELLYNVQLDLPDTGLNRDSLHSCFSGIRTLAVRGRYSHTAHISRRHAWHFEGSLLTLLGGKFTTAASTVEEGLSIILGMTDLGGKLTSLHGRLLGGAIGLSQAAENFRKAGKSAGLAETIYEAAIQRHGSRVGVLQQADPTLETLQGRYLRSEIAWVMQNEQALNFLDVARRLQLENLSDYGISVLDALARALSQFRAEIDWSSQTDQYCRMIENKRKLMGLRPLKETLKA